MNSKKNNTESNKPIFIELKKIGKNELGFISVAETQKHIPFDIKRVYWTYSTPENVTRGGHAHKELHQVIFAVNGSIEFQIETSDGNKLDFILNEPNKGLYIPPMTWRDIKFSENSVLLCLASELYLEDDYIRDYDNFKVLSQ